MRPDDRGTLCVALLMGLLALWLGWALLPSLHPAAAFLIVLWLLIAAWMTTR